MNIPPNEEELELTMNSIKPGKASGRNDLTPYLLKFVDTVFSDHYLEPFKLVWECGKSSKRLG